MWTLSRGMVVSLLALLMTAGAPMGCVAQREADDLAQLNRKKSEQIIELEARLEECQARVDALQSDNPSAAMRDQLEQAIAERDQLEQALAEAEQRLREAALIGPALPQPLSDALADLAASNPGLMAYDAERGMVKFTSDLTFALGSTEVSQQAQTALRRLAEIIQSPMASEYEVKVVGHTDNVPINRPQTKAKHPTNWHLSVHRAIAVKDVLEQAGVGPRRMQVAGYGPYRPVVPNPDRGGNAANRRVEIYLQAMTSSSRASAGGASRSGQASTRARDEGVEQAEPVPAQFK